MGTRSLIAVKKDNELRITYCQCDGGLKHTGVILSNHYQSLDKINELMNLGDLTAIASEIKDCVLYDGTPPNGIKSLKNLISSYAASNIDYVYIFENNEWLVLNKSNKEEENYNVLTPLTTSLFDNNINQGA